MPSMDSQNPSRRFRTRPASHPPPPQAPADPPAGPNRQDSSGSDSGSFGGQGAARQPPRPQEPQHGQGVTGASAFAQNPGFNDVGRGDNAYATIRAHSAQYGGAGPFGSAQGPQFVQEGGHGQLQYAFAGYGVPAPSLSPSTGSPQPTGNTSSDSSSPPGSAGSQLSQHSGGMGPRSPPDVFHAPGVAGHAHRAHGPQIGTEGHVQGVYNASPQSFSPEPPYGAYIRHGGLEQAGYGNVAHGMAGDASRRPPAHRFVSTGIVAGPPSQNTPRHIHGRDQFVHPHAPSHLQTPQLDLRTHQLSREDSPVHYGGPQQPYGVPILQPPFMDAGSVQQPQPPLTHIAAANLGENLTLDMLSDSAIPGEKPNYPYPTLIKAAILGSPRKALTLQGIYKALEDRFEWFRSNRNDKAWQNSIRHNLSLNKMFRRLAKPITEPGKGSYWTVDFAAGEGNKRERKRTKRAGMAEQARRAMEGDAPSSSHQDNSVSSGEESDVPGHSFPPAPYLGRPIYQEPSIDPALLTQGRMSPQRRPRLSPAPYARPAFPMSVPAPAVQDPRVAALGQFSMRPGQTATFGNPTFGGPQGLDPWEASFLAGPMGPPTWGTQASAPPTFEVPFSPAGPAPSVGYQPQMPAHTTRGHAVRAVTASPAVATAGPSRAPAGAQSNAPVYHHGSLAVSAETVGSAAGTSSSSASEAGSARSGNVGGAGVPQVYRHSSSSSSSQSS